MVAPSSIRCPCAMPGQGGGKKPRRARANQQATCQSKMKRKRKETKKKWTLMAQHATTSFFFKSFFLFSFFFSNSPFLLIDGTCRPTNVQMNVRRNVHNLLNHKCSWFFFETINYNNLKLFKCLTANLNDARQTTMYKSNFKFNWLRVGSCGRLPNALPLCTSVSPTTDLTDLVYCLYNV